MLFQYPFCYRNDYYLVGGRKVSHRYLIEMPTVLNMAPAMAHLGALALTSRPTEQIPRRQEFSGSSLHPEA
jgi:hypothetical protein